jgi:hypothetical protein
VGPQMSPGPSRQHAPIPLNRRGGTPLSSVRFQTGAAIRFSEQIRGGESGPAAVAGLLLGSVDTSEEGRKVTIRGFLPLPCATPTHISESFQTENSRIIDDSLRQWDPSVQQRVWVVGYYRSQAYGALRPDEADFALLRRKFPKQSLALLLQTLDDGTILSELFQCAESGLALVPGGALLLLNLDETDSDVKATSGRTAPSVAIWRKRLPWLGIPALLVAGLVFWQRISDFRSRVAAGGSAGAAAYLQGADGVSGQGARLSPMADAASVLANEIGLQIDGRPGLYRIQWNRESPAIVNARSGWMTISAGSSERMVLFNHEELATGTIALTAGNQDVRVRLEITTNSGQKVAANAILLSPNGSVPSQPARRQTLPQTLPLTSASAAAPSTTPVGAAPAQPAAPPVRPTAQLVENHLAQQAPPVQMQTPAAENAATQRPVSAPAANRTEQLPRAAQPAPVPAVTPPAPEPTKVPLVEPQPAAASGVQGSGGPAPRQTPPAPNETPAPAASAPVIVPARLIKTVQPRLPAQTMRFFEGPAPVIVEVEVEIDSTGRVTSTRAVEPPVFPATLVVGAARAAAALCRFEPARRDNRPVRSSFVIRYSFSAAR